jgi:hypothetical protein
MYMPAPHLPCSNGACTMSALRIAVLSMLLVTSSMLAHVSQAALVYTTHFDLGESFGQNPFSVENAFLRIESFGPNVRYWQPSQANVTGIVTYKLDVPFPIETAELSTGITAYTVGSDANFDSGAATYLDVSPDNLNWTNIASQTPTNAVFSGIAGPWDISSLVAGSDVVYFRARMFMTTNYSGFGTSQFIRSVPPAGPTLTATSATSTVPEPCTWAIWFLLIGGFGFVAWWRRPCPGPCEVV